MFLLKRRLKSEALPTQEVSSLSKRGFQAIEELVRGNRKEVSPK
jgi:hypothetical protein